jgi:hypothetical protein
LDFDKTLADEDPLGAFVDPGHPRVADKLRIQCRNTLRFVRISCRGSLQLNKTCPSMP